MERNEASIDQHGPAIAAAFDRWMDDYINNPAAFAAIEESARAHAAARAAGQTPTYGEGCAAILLGYMKA